MKNYGTRTLIGNWYEERITLEAYEKKKNPDYELKTRDMTIDLHINANEENPKMMLDTPFEGETTYAIETSKQKLEKRNELRNRIYTANHRRRLEGTRSIAQESLPGSTITPNFLSKQFYDPNKTRYKTVYMKSYNRPEFESIRGTLQTSQESTRPRVNALTDHWNPTWKE